MKSGFIFVDIYYQAKLLNHNNGLKRHQGKNCL